jgi:NTE family protein
MVPGNGRLSPEVAFVLPGGGSAGAAQVGILRSLLEAGIRPDVLVGCSVGALNAAFFAVEPTLDQVDRMETLWRGLSRGTVFGAGRTGLVALEVLVRSFAVSRYARLPDPAGRPGRANR